MAFKKNIARGTTDPEIDSITWIKLGNAKKEREMETCLTGGGWFNAVFQTCSDLAFV